MLGKKQPTWVRAVPVKQSDNLISSEYNEAVKFKPSYEQTNEPISMFKLLAMDYARQWHVEKQQVKEVIVISNEPAFLQRRYVIRGFLRKLQQTHTEEKRFIMKRFMNIPSRYKGQEKTPKIIPKKVEAVTELSNESVTEVSPCSAKTNLLAETSEEKETTTSDEKTIPKKVESLSDESVTSCSCDKNLCECEKGD